MEPSSFNVVIDQSHFKLRESSLEYIAKKIEKLDLWTRKFPRRSCHISQEHSEREGTHRFTISLDLSNATLVGHAEEKHLRGAFDRAFKKLMRQLNEFKQLLRREHLKGKTPAAGHAPTPASFPYASPEHELEVFRKDAQQARRSLEDFLEFEIRLLQQRQPEFKVDQSSFCERVMEEAISKGEDKPRRVSARGWLFEVGLRMLEEEAAKAPKVQPQAGANDLSSTASLLKAFFVEDGEPTPHDFDRLLGARLAELPRDWRRCFRLHYVEDLDVESIERILELSREQVEFRLRGASEFLRDHLEENGGR
ncbi:MAG: HPF/RaiA family ribosome-associated protein [Planctomycetota bacterium]